MLICLNFRKGCFNIVDHGNDSERTTENNSEPFIRRREDVEHPVLPSGGAPLSQSADPHICPHGPSPPGQWSPAILPIKRQRLSGCAEAAVVSDPSRRVCGAVQVQRRTICFQYLPKYKKTVSFLYITGLILRYPQNGVTSELSQRTTTTTTNKSI